ncbi:hypothetical protein [Oceanicoccus sagamiensis]|uniref:Uncharacterized protein n=1 Tax=Oceanicoccus sagamiensis TaxID=716816 RepID=A0A1X9NAS2_9GAMM|nr:hypothetical protein [Oceanicoccus sagamiensis]ARN75138.1 hypothetical protein BST96_14040 [Oceanicoccus sagamiensis]
MKSLWQNSSTLSSHLQQPAMESPDLEVLAARVPGNGHILRDNSSGLEWLNVQATLGLSYEQVIHQSQKGAALHGWWYASLTEAQILLSRFGFDVIDGVYQQGVDELQQAVEWMNAHLGETIAFSRAFPAIAYRGSVLMTGSHNANQQRLTLPVFYQQDSDNHNIDIETGIGVGDSAVPPYISSLLVRHRSVKNTTGFWQ